MASSSSSSTSSTSSTSSSSYCCNVPVGYGSASAPVFTAWTFSGMSEHNSDNCKLYILFVAITGLIQQVQVYKNSGLTQLVAIGQGTVGSITLSARNSSGLTGSVTWNGTTVAYPATGSLRCIPLSSSSSTGSSSSSSIISSSSSTQSSYSTSSSSSDCCTNPDCVGGSCNHFSAWTFAGMNDNNSTGCKLYAGFDKFGGQQQVQIYKDSARTQLVAIGQGAVGVIALATQNSSGLSGTVVWDGISVYYTSSLILDCDASSSSSQSSQSSSSSESESSSSITSFSSSISSSSSRSSGSSSSTSSTEHIYSSSSSSSSSESVGNTSSSSSSNPVIWNRIKPVLLGMASVDTSLIKNKLAQTISLRSATYTIGKVYVYLFGPYGYSKAYTVHMDIYDCTNDGIPSTILSSQTIAGTGITGEGWYYFDFNVIDAPTPSNGYLSFVVWQEGGDEDNCVMWGYLDIAAPEGMTAWFTNDLVVWKQHLGIVRAIKVVSIFDAYDLTDYQLVSPPASQETVTPTVDDGDAILDGVEVTNNHAVIRYSDFLTAFVVDSSGSMGWNDRFSTRQEFINQYIDRFRDYYPQTNLIDMVSFGALLLDFSSVFSNIGRPATINLDLRQPTRTTYVFTVSGASASAGAVYVVGDVSFTVMEAIVSGSRLMCYGSADPIPAGNLVLDSGTGGASIAFTTFDASSIDKGIVAYGFKNMETKHAYNIGQVVIDSVVIDTPSTLNWNAFNNGQAFTFSVGNNGPQDSQSLDFTNQDDNVVRKSLGQFTYQSARLIETAIEGSTQVRVDNVSIVSQGSQVDIVGRNHASTGHFVDAVNSTNLLLTISPPGRFETPSWSIDNGIVQQSNIRNAIQITGSTLQLLVRDTGVSDNAVITFYLQTAAGYMIEWDFKPFKKWIINNWYWLDETAFLPVSLFDVDGDPFPDGTKVVYYVDHYPTDAELKDQAPSTFLALDADAGDYKVFVQSTADFLREMQVDVVDNTGSSQHFLIYEIGTEDGLGYLKFEEALEYNFTVANESRVIAYLPTSEEISDAEKAAVEANRLSPSIAVVDATPIYAGRNINPDLLEKYDPPPVSPSTTWDELNLDRDRIRINIEDAPTIDGYVMLRVLPITEDNLKTVQSKKDESARLLRLGNIPSVTDQSDQNSVQIEQYLANATTTTTTTYITVGSDYVISNPVYSFNGLASGTMTTSATNLEKYSPEGVNTPGFSDGENAVVLAKQYSIYPSVIIESQSSHALMAQQFLDTFDIFFTPSVDIFGVYDGDRVPYYLPVTDGGSGSGIECGIVTGYTAVNTPGPYATGNGFTINYTVTNKGILAQNGNLRIRIYANKYINQDELNHQLAKAYPTDLSDKEAIDTWQGFYRDKKLNYVPPATSEIVNGQVVVTQPLSDIDEWRDAVENNPIINETDPLSAEIHKSPAFDSVIDPLSYFGFYTVSNSASFTVTDISTLSTEATTDSGVDTKKWAWTWADQYEAYDLTIPINADGKHPGKATLTVPSSDIVSLLLIQASQSFGDNRFEAVTTSLVFVANPIGVKELLPYNAYPSGGTTKYAVGATITWRGDPIDINTMVSFIPAKTKISGTSKVVNTAGWSQGSELGPHAPVEFVKGSDPTKLLCPPLENESIGVGVSYGGYSILLNYKSMTWLGAIPSDIDRTGQFGIRVTNINDSEDIVGGNLFGGVTLWADGTDVLWQVDLFDGLNATSSYVNYFHSDGVDRLMGKEQTADAEFPLGSPTLVTGPNVAPMRWLSPGKVTFRQDGVNLNIGAKPADGSSTSSECPRSENRPYGDTASIGSSYQFTNPTTGLPDSRSGMGVTIPLPRDITDECIVPPMAYFAEPLSITIEMESDHSTYLRDGADSPLIVAEVKWKGKPITSKYTPQNGDPQDFPFPYVTFAAGTSGQMNRVWVPKGLSGYWKTIDRRGGIEDCLAVVENDDVVLTSYRVQVGLMRTSIYTIPGSTHTHACTVDSDGTGSTTSTINLNGEFDPHTHTIANYVVSTNKGHNHTLRSVAITQLKPTRNISLDITINGQVRYDPTMCAIWPGESSNPDGNRMVFKSMYLNNPSQRRLLLALGAGDNNQYEGDFDSRKRLQDCEQDLIPTCGDEIQPPRLYTSMTVTDTPKAFNILAYARYSEYTDPSTGDPVPEQPVPDGTRINFQIDAYKAVDPADSTVSSLVIRRDATKKYMVLKVRASTSDTDAAEATFDLLIEILSLYQWLPGIKSLVDEPSDDTIYLNNAVAKIRTMGASQINDAVLLAAQRITQYQTDNPSWQSAHKAILLLTDGDENTSENSIDQAINNVNFINGNCEVPVIAVRMGASYSSDDVLLRKYSTQTCGQYNYLVNPDVPTVAEVVDEIIYNGQALSTNYGTYTNTIDMGSDNIIKDVSLGGVIVPAGTRMVYRVRHSSDQVNWSAWSDYKDSAVSLDFDMSLDSRDRYLQYEVFFYGDQNFVSPSFQQVSLSYYKPQSVTTFFQPISLNINSDEYLSSIHITHTATIPVTSEINYGYSQMNSTDTRDYSSITRPVITPDRHTIILTRFNEVFLTSDYRTYTAINGGWSKLAQIEIRRITKDNNVTVLSQTDCAINNYDGTITFSNIQDRTDTFTLCVFFDPVFRVTCNITNYGTSSASVDHVGILYNVAKRIPRDINGSIVYTPIRGRIT